MLTYRDEFISRKYKMEEMYQQFVAEDEGWTSIAQVNTTIKELQMIRKENITFRTSCRGCDSQFGHDSQPGRDSQFGRYPQNHR